jgi:hypothetical protein
MADFAVGSPAALKRRVIGKLIDRARRDTGRAGGEGQRESANELTNLSAATLPRLAATKHKTQSTKKGRQGPRKKESSCIEG